MDLAEALEYLDRHTNYEAGDLPIAGQESGLTLEPVRRLLHVLGDPQDAYPAIHVTGTNGKGSVVGMVAALLAAQGLTAGTFTSPHVQRLAERMTRNGEPIDDEALGRIIGDVAAVEELAGVHPTYFEILTAAALAWFAEAGVDVAVVEVGLLGRWDATNVVAGKVAVVTNIGRDHTDGVGDWRARIAAEKAGIVEAGAPLVLGESDPDLLPIFEAEGPDPLLVLGRDVLIESDEVAVGGRAFAVRTPWARHEGFVSLHGSHQVVNAALAIAAVEAFFDRALPTDVVTEALSELRLGARFEVMGRHPLVVLDGSHNPDGARAAARTIDDFTVDRRVLVLGMLEGRDPAEFLEALELRPDDVVIACEADSPRAVAPGVIARAAEDLGAGADVIPDPVEAFERAHDLAGDHDIVFVGGSLYVAGAVRTALQVTDLLASEPGDGPADP